MEQNPSNDTSKLSVGLPTLIGLLLGASEKGIHKVSWERRRGTDNLYYYRTIKQNGRQRRQYIGTGFVGYLGALEDEERSRQHQEQRQAWQAEQEFIRQSELLTTQFVAAVDHLAKNALSAAGYVKKRGEWRPR